MSLYRELIMRGCAELLGASDSSRLDVELLLAHAAGISRTELIANAREEVEADIVKEFEKLLEKRKHFAPIAYLIGKKEFYGLDFEVNQSVLIPRPDTELIVDKALEHAERFPEPIRILDLGTGSACIVVAIAHELNKNGKFVQALALDKMSAALEVAERNIAKHALAEVVKVKQSDWLSELTPFEDTFDIIVCNPPYISPTAANLSPELRFEPVEALFAKQAGLEEIERILTHVQAFMAKNAVLLCEIGFDQKDAVLELAKNYFPGQNMQVLKDLADNPRVLEILK